MRLESALQHPRNELTRQHIMCCSVLEEFRVTQLVKKLLCFEGHEDSSPYSQWLLKFAFHTRILDIHFGITLPLTPSLPRCQLLVVVRYFAQISHLLRVLHV
jgi:hypothetical protein